METILDTTKPSLCENLKAKIATAVTAVVADSLAIRGQIQTLTEQVTQKRATLHIAEVKIDELNEQRQTLITEGKSADEIYKDFDAVIVERNRLNDEIDIIENKALPDKQKELATCQDKIRAGAMPALDEQKNVIVAEFQDLFDRMAEIYGQWGDLCKDTQTQYNLQFLLRRMNPFLPIALSDSVRKAIVERVRKRRPQK